MTTTKPRAIPYRNSNLQHESHTEGKVLKPLKVQSHIPPIFLNANRLEKGPPDLGKERQLLQPKHIVTMPNRYANALTRNNTDSQKNGYQK